MKKHVVTHIKTILVILVGSFILSVGINYFAFPNHLAEGGFTGIALLLSYLFKWEPGIIIFIMNLPLLFIGYKELGKQSFAYTLLGLSSVSLFLMLTKDWALPSEDLLLVALYTGVLVGSGLGLIFRVGGTTGGVDILACLANKYWGWSIGRTIFLFDVAVITASIFVIGLNMAMYTLVAVFVGTRVIDFFVEGINVSKAVTIVSLRPKELAQIITQEMNRGVTLLQGEGAYTGDRKEVLYVVVATTELPKIKQIVLQTDPTAFVVVHETKEVLGEGFSKTRVKV